MDLGFALVWLLTIGMTAIATFACVSPRRSSQLYGVPQHDPAGHVWVRAAAVRDLALVLLLVTFLVRGAAEAAGLTAVATGLVAVVDLASVTVRNGFRPLSAAVHAAGITTGIVGGVLLLT